VHFSYVNFIYEDSSLAALHPEMWVKRQ